MSDEQPRVELPEELTLDEALEYRDAIQTLLRSRGWQIVEAVLAAQINARRRFFELPLESLDGAMKQEFLKGEMNFGNVVLGLPNVLIEATDAEIERYQQSAEPEAEETEND